MGKNIVVLSNTETDKEGRVALRKLERTFITFFFCYNRKLSKKKFLAYLIKIALSIIWFCAAKYFKLNNIWNIPIEKKSVRL